MKIRYQFLLFFLLTLFSLEMTATHIVGGVIYYKSLGGNKYLLTFEIYRDCSPSVVVGFDGTTSNIPNTQLPDFYFSVFEGNVNSNIYLNDNALKLLDTILIRPVIVNPCLEIDRNTCVVKGRYEKIITLPKSDKGYTIQYMRCCRNSSILNIENQIGQPDKPGITLRTYIPPYGTVLNNSAVFKNFPPIFICKNQKFYFDHSATDIDGDQLVYSITTPLSGLSTNMPADRVQTLDVDPIVWSAGYGVNNVMGGTPPMTIDSTTGLLTCKPDKAGRFVVSITVKEKRNGVIIDSFARDFQYNVLECDIPNADAPFIQGTYDPEEDIGLYIDCGNLTIPFTNYSTNADRYLWKFGDPRSGASNTSTDKDPTHTFTDTGTYVVTLIAFKTKSNGQLCIDSTRRICRLYPRPTMSFDFTEVCEGLPVQFTERVSRSGGNINSWQWTFGDGGSSTIQNPNYTYSTSGKYNVKLKISTSNGCNSDTSIPINIFPKPTIGANIDRGCIYQPMNLSCNVTIPTPYSVSSYRWTLPNGVKINNCNANYTPTTTVSGTVNLWAISDKGCSDSANFTFVVNPLPKIYAGRDTSLCYDQNTTLTATGGVSYQWTPTSYLSTPNQATTLASPPYPDSILYYVKGTDGNGCSNLDTVKIKFHLKTYISAGADTSICLNASSPKYRDNVQLDGKGTFISFYWTPPTGLDNANARNPIAKPTINTDYVFNGLDLNNCLMKDTVRVTVLDPRLDLIPIGDVFICQGDSIQVSALDQGAGSTYRWTPRYWISDPNTREPFLKPLDTTAYILTVENYCYRKSDTIIVNASELPDPGLKALDSICLGDTYQFISTQGFSDYTWATNEPSFSNKKIYNPTAKPTYSQQYILTVIDRYSCKNTDSIMLNVNYPPSVSILGLPKYICQGDSVKLTAFAAKSTFEWWDKRYLSSDTGSSVYAFPWDTTRFYCRATTFQKCSTTVSFLLPVQKPIYPYAKRPVQICTGKFIHLYASGGLYYLWKPPYNIDDTFSSTPQVFPENTFTYTAYISNDCFQDSIKVDVYVDSLPKVQLGNDTTIYRGQEIDLIAKTHAETIEWFPKESISTNPFTTSIRVSPFDTTLYRVEATNSRGCVGTDSIYVFVYGKNVLLVPTGFSPNKDGINDVFRIARHLNIRKLNLFEVYNRWGQKIFSTQDIDKGWDGQYNGEMSPAGVYVWKVEAVSNEGEKILQSGNVTLIR